MTNSKLRLLFLLPITFTASCSDSKIESEFIAGCVQSGGQKSLCECTFDKIKKSYNPEKLEEIYNQKAPHPEFLEKTINFSMACRKEYFSE